MNKTREILRVSSAYHIKWTEGTKHKIKPGEALVKVITEKFGGRRPTAEQLIKEAKKKSSPIHDLDWEWDVKKAAEKHWKERAMYFLRSIETVTISTKTGLVVSGPVRFEIPTSKLTHRPQVYRVAGEIGDDPEDTEIVLDRIRSDFRAFVSRYRRYVWFLEMFDPLIKGFEKIEKKLDSTSPEKKKVG